MLLIRHVAIENIANKPFSSKNVAERELPQRKSCRQHIQGKKNGDNRLFGENILKKKYFCSKKFSQKNISYCHYIANKTSSETRWENHVARLFTAFYTKCLIGDIFEIIWLIRHFVIENVAEEVLPQRKCCKQYI